MNNGIFQELKIRIRPLIELRLKVLTKPPNKRMTKQKYRAMRRSHMNAVEAKEMLTRSSDYDNATTNK